MTPQAVAVPSSRFALARVALPALALQLAFGSAQAWGVVAPAMLADGWPPLLVSGIYSASAGVYAAAAVSAGRLADRLPPRRLCWISVGLLWAGFAVAFTVPTGATLLLGYSGLAMGLAGAIGASGALAAGAAVAPERVGTVGGLLTAAYALAAVIEAPPLARLIAATDWVTGLRVLGVVLAVVAALAMLVMPRLPAAPRATANNTPGRANDDKIAVSELLRRPGIRAGCLMELCATPLGAYAIVVLATEADARGFGLGAGTIAVTVTAAASVTGRLVAGSAADRVSGLWVCTAILAAVAAAAVLLVAPGGLAPFQLGALAAGLGYGGAAGAMARIGADGAPAAPTTAFGLLYATFCTGSAVGPLLGTAVGGPAAWLVLGGLALTGLATMRLTGTRPT